MIGSHSVLGLIAARGGSKGIPGKNIADVGGRPLIQWTIEAARNSRHIDRVILSCDDTSIIEVARSLKCDVPFRRDAALATDEASSIDVVVDALERVSGYDIVVLLQPTSPLRTSADIDCAIELLLMRDAPAVVSVRPADDHPLWTFKVDAEGKLTRYLDADPLPTRRQDLPPAWCLNGALYVARVEWFLRERTFLCPSTLGYEMPACRSLDIDTFADLEAFRAAVGATPAALR